MAKYEFVKETKIKSLTEDEVFWYTKKDGVYVTDSLSFNEQVARDRFEIIKVKGSLIPTVEVVETYEN